MVVEGGCGGRGDGEGVGEGQAGEETKLPKRLAEAVCALLTTGLHNLADCCICT